MKHLYHLSRAAIAFSIYCIVGSAVYGASVPESGRPAPDFALQDQEGANISLDQYHGKWVVLYFYPKDFTNGCTIEAHNFEVAQPEFAKRHAVIIGVSFDTVDSHKSFCAKEGLNFKLLADTTGKVSDMYGSTLQKDGKTLSARNSFVIDPNGIIRKEYIHVEPLGHSKQLIGDLDVLEAQAK